MQPERRPWLTSVSSVSISERPYVEGSGPSQSPRIITTPGRQVRDPGTRYSAATRLIGARCWSTIVRSPPTRPTASSRSPTNSLSAPARGSTDRNETSRRSIAPRRYPRLDSDLGRDRFDLQWHRHTGTRFPPPSGLIAPSSHRRRHPQRPSEPTMHIAPRYSRSALSAFTGGLPRHRLRVAHRVVTMGRRIIRNNQQGKCDGLRPVIPVVLARSCSNPFRLEHNLERYRIKL